MKAPLFRDPVFDGAADPVVGRFSNGRNMQPGIWPHGSGIIRWSDGIDIMACFHIDIEDIFMRNSDDCIAVYGTRWDFYGDTRYVTVRNSVLWADVALPIMMGTHGDHHKDGDTIEHICFENIDILEHHELQ
ncbi:hypothetical protein ASG89_33950 [Paenibacillus sp. Soil766]|uniref:hypothetical protein n=1 Tax=Paenibacillus sp. Soil766 TaxID=1736404 RepID=UPI00071104A4|nr:hypothetical protein [Paenibacillus sp. Soil766]KRE92061.1 hypothetical protein ASG89_33950 [Paenibacillus sp. Soil766]